MCINAYASVAVETELPAQFNAGLGTNAYDDAIGRNPRAIGKHQAVVRYRAT
jgi:hypothetical protein